MYLMTDRNKSKQTDENSDSMIVVNVIESEETVKLDDIYCNTIATVELSFTTINRQKIEQRYGDNFTFLIQRKISESIQIAAKQSASNFDFANVVKEKIKGRIYASYNEFLRITDISVLTYFKEINDTTIMSEEDMEKSFPNISEPTM